MKDSQKHQIFIIDDSRVQLVLMERILKSEGFSVRSFTNGNDMINVLKDCRPGLIISDIDMPVMNGFELIREVRKKPKGKEIPFFLISSQGELSIREKALEMGAELFFKKPLKYNILLDVIREKIAPVEV